MHHPLPVVLYSSSASDSIDTLRWRQNISLLWRLGVFLKCLALVSHVFLWISCCFFLHLHLMLHSCHAFLCSSWKTVLCMNGITIDSKSSSCHCFFVLFFSFFCLILLLILHQTGGVTLESNSSWNSSAAVSNTSRRLADATFLLSFCTACFFYSFSLERFSSRAPNV